MKEADGESRNEGEGEDLVRRSNIGSVIPGRVRAFIFEGVPQFFVGARWSSSAIESIPNEIPFRKPSVLQGSS